MLGEMDSDFNPAREADSGNQEAPFIRASESSGQ